MRIDSHLLTAMGIIAMSTPIALAETAPPIKPGLWEMQVEREGGRKLPDIRGHLKNLTPEQRKKLEAKMKERGVDMSDGLNRLKVCFDKESLAQGRWQGAHDGQCKTDMSNQGTTIWKWHSVCGEPSHSVIDGEATFTNSENYVVKTSTTMTIRGETRATQSTIKSKWMGSDCGDLKPVHAIKQRQSPPTKQE